MSGEDPRLVSLREHLHQAETDLRGLGYRVERLVYPPGARISNQLLEVDSVILVLFGAIRVESAGEIVDLGPGDRLDIPSGVPNWIEVTGETSVYLLHAVRETRPQAPPGQPSPGLAGLDPLEP